MNDKEPCAEGDDDCSKATSLVDFYLDGLLEIDDRTFIQQHLDECPGCRHGFEFESTFNARVRSLAPIYMPEDVKSHIMLSLGFPGMSGSANPSVTGIPKGEIPKGRIPGSKFFRRRGASSSDDQ